MMQPDVRGIRSDLAMAMKVINTAQLMCTFGLAPSVLMVTPKNLTMTTDQPQANIMDSIPMMNIMPFGMCSSLANPEVASATAAALGVLTPMPCIPVTVAPWVPGSPTVLVANMPALQNSSKCMCTWGGVISIVTPGQFTSMAP
jgi:Domain of unknown function (DUF4280)